MQLTADDRNLIKAFNQRVDWLRLQDSKHKQSEVWGSYDEASKILSRSKAWFKIKRLGEINEFKILVPAVLVKGKDWRMVGNRVEYRMESIKMLKAQISTL